MNHTNQPHTFSLVEADQVPTTNSEVQRQCYKPGATSAARSSKWHHVHGQQVRRNPVDAGGSGWDTEGNLHRKGDSVVYARADPS